MKIEGYNTITIVLQCGEGLSVPFRPSLKGQKERKFTPSSSQKGRSDYFKICRVRVGKTFLYSCTVTQVQKVSHNPMEDQRRSLDIYPSETLLL